MTPEQMIHMMEVLFPHMNITDKEAFLTDIQESQPEKFPIAWRGILPRLTQEEAESLIGRLKLEFFHKVSL